MPGTEALRERFLPVGLGREVATGAQEDFAFPDLLTTNIVFGGDDMMDAWVTLSTSGRLAKCRWPRPGLRLAHYA